MIIDDLKKLNALVDLCLERRIRQLKLGEVDLYFDDTAFQDNEIGVKAGPEDKSLQMPDDESLLNWSTSIVPMEEPKN